MGIRIGLLSSNFEVIEGVRSNYPAAEIIKYRSPDMARPESEVLLIDLDTFEESESIQFFLSRIRKKIQNLHPDLSRASNPALESPL